MTSANHQPEKDSPTTGVPVPGQGGALPPDWAEVLAGEVTRPYWAQLQRYVAAQRAEHEVYPAPEDVFAAFEATPYEQVRVVILGQDPYFNPGEATGLAFAVAVGTRIPPSLHSILSELREDCGVTASSDLTGWARQGVLLLNTTLTVRRGKANSHEGQGWETLTDAVIRAISAQKEGVVFALWGEVARNKKQLIDAARHHVIEAAHPKAWATARDPLRGSKPFSRINELLRGEPIDWSAS
jgi:uracil-DNA glycosylase